MADTASRARLLQLLAPAVQATGHDLEDLTVSPAGRRKVVRVVVDKDGGVTLDDIAEVSRVVSDVLDQPEAEAALAGAYTLEVTSPGVDRPLTQPRHWRRSAGRLVKVKPAGGQGPDTVTGRVVEADEAQVTLDVAGVKRAFLYAEIAHAVVQVEFSRGEVEA
jgi:ribosome maturation factor RimP